MGSTVAVTLVAIIAAAALLLNPSPVSAQPACIASLAPCSQYLSNTARPGSDCCTPLANVARTNVTCLCDLAQLAATASINVTRALELPVQCNIPGVDASTCGGIALAPGASSQPPPPQAGANSEPPSSALTSLPFSYVTTLGVAIAASGLLFVTL